MLLMLRITGDVSAQEILFLNDFCACDYSSFLDEVYSRFSIGTDEATFELVYGDGLVSMFRKFSKDHEQLIDYEFVQISGDTFYYWEYDEQGILLGNGPIVFLENNLSMDTIRYLELDSTISDFINKVRIVNYKQGVKTGQWFERAGTLQMTGAYSNGLKTGVWDFINWQENSWRKVAFSNGVRVTEQETNLLASPKVMDFEAFHAVLTEGEWYIRLKGDRLELSRKRIGDKAVFSIDGAFRRSGRHGSLSTTWRMLPQVQILEIGKEQIRLQWFSEDRIEGIIEKK